MGTLLTALIILAYYAISYAVTYAICLLIAFIVEWVYIKSKDIMKDIKIKNLRSKMSRACA